MKEMLDINNLEGSLGQRVYTVLRDRILDLGLEPGAILRKSVLCDQLNVSRSPVAEALGRLSSEGLVDIVPQSATRVSRFDMAELREEDFLREAVEVAAVARFAANPAEDQLVKLSRNLRLQSLLVEDGDDEGFFEADLDFHHLILSFTGFPNVARVAEDMTLQLRRARKLILPKPGRPAEALKEHQAVYDAIAERDIARAKTAMSEHLGQLMHAIAPLEQRHPEYFRS